MLTAMTKNSDKANNKIPELLCPAGSPLALDAAIEGGADAVYLGSSAFNARIHASNFGKEELKQAVRRAHAYGVKVYLTLNTLIFDREMPDYLHTAAFAQEAGVDALIVADLGGATVLHRELPDLVLHASTQAAAHNAAAGALFADLGFHRMVVARELPLTDLRTVVQESSIEIEAFVHGALCVCHSGQCLFSSLVGGRSGNRGECAQPCRLPFRTEKGHSDYPLSLKDLSLARHVPALIDAGIASLKIEGRMRSPEYVLTVTRIWRKLLDEGRAATDHEIARLSEAFSRSGFTDGYFTSRINHSMLGIRSESDKQAGRNLAPFRGLTRRIPLDMQASVRKNEPSLLTVCTGSHSFTAQGEIPQAALRTPLDELTVQRQLTKLGNTPFELNGWSLTLDDGLTLPISSLNALRRVAVEGMLAEQQDKEPSLQSEPVYIAHPSENKRAIQAEYSACMTHPSQLTHHAQAFFDICYLPPEHLLSLNENKLREIQQQVQLGVVIPPVVMDHENDVLIQALKQLAARGIQRALCGNAGHFTLVRQAGFLLDGDFRLNVTNSETVALLDTLGVQKPILSPELTLPQIRDIAGDVRTIIYGRIPLMVVEKCVIQETTDCKACKNRTAALVDRRGARFPVLRMPPHRNVIYNSVPTYMADAKQSLNRYRTGGWHFIFSIEAPREVDSIILAYQQGLPSSAPVRRIGK